MTRFPTTPSFTGMNRPSRIEFDVFELEYEGTIPPEIDGAFYRCGPDPQFPPLLGDDIYINGDGTVSMFRIAGGHVDLKHRYVRTDRFEAERRARRALFGAYRNPYTDDPSVAEVDRTTANTNAVFHAGRLFALKEDGLPHEIDPLTLETRGKWDFGGRLRSRTCTAHPKIDPVSGELVFFGYAARGDEVSSDIAYCTAAADGTLTREEWLLPPYASMIHDWLVSQEHVVFPVMPVAAEPTRLKEGGPRWAWDPTLATHLGVLPRGGTADDVRWFSGPAAWSFHTMNAVTEGRSVHLDLCVSRRAPFPDTAGEMFAPDEPRQYLTRWTCDLSRGGTEFTSRVLWDDMPTDFPVVDARHLTRPYRIGFAAAKDLSRPVNPELAKGVHFNSLVRIDLSEEIAETYYVGDDASVQEPVFVPRGPDAPEGDGYLLAVVDRYPLDRAELLILDTAHLADGPVATVHAPLFLRPAFHGNWVPGGRLR